jgi:hypothetical protein
MTPIASVDGALFRRLAKMGQGFRFEPRAMPRRTSEQRGAMLVARYQHAVALGTMELDRMLLAKLLEQPPILIARPLILARLLDVVDLVAKSISIVRHHDLSRCSGA